jgi:hypothetical protein
VGQRDRPLPTQGMPETDSLYALTQVRDFNAPSTRPENTTGSGRSASQMLRELGKSVHRKLHSGYKLDRKGGNNFPSNILQLVEFHTNRMPHSCTRAGNKGLDL